MLTSILQLVPAVTCHLLALLPEQAQVHFTTGGLATVNRPAHKMQTPLTLTMDGILYVYSFLIQQIIVPTAIAKVFTLVVQTPTVFVMQTLHTVLVQMAALL